MAKLKTFYAQLKDLEHCESAAKAVANDIKVLSKALAEDKPGWRKQKDLSDKTFKSPKQLDTKAAQIAKLEGELQAARACKDELEQRMATLQREHAQAQPDTVEGKKEALHNSQKLLDAFKAWAPDGPEGEQLRNAAAILEAEVARQKAAAEQARAEAEAEARRAADNSSQEGAETQAKATSKAEMEVDQEEAEAARQHMAKILQAHLANAEELDEPGSRKRAEELMALAGAQPTKKAKQTGGTQTGHHS